MFRSHPSPTASASRPLQMCASATRRFAATPLLDLGPRSPRPPVPARFPLPCAFPLMDPMTLPPPEVLRPSPCVFNFGPRRRAPSARRSLPVAYPLTVCWCSCCQPPFTPPTSSTQRLAGSGVRTRSRRNKTKPTRRATNDVNPSSHSHVPRISPVHAHVMQPLATKPQEPIGSSPPRHPPPPPPPPKDNTPVARRPPRPTLKRLFPTGRGAQALTKKRRHPIPPRTTHARARDPPAVPPSAAARRCRCRCRPGAPLSFRSSTSAAQALKPPPPPCRLAGAATKKSSRAAAQRNSRISSDCGKHKHLSCLALEYFLIVLRRLEADVCDGFCVCARCPWPPKSHPKPPTWPTYLPPLRQLRGPFVTRLRRQRSLT